MSASDNQAQEAYALRPSGQISAVPRSAAHEQQHVFAEGAHQHRPWALSDIEYFDSENLVDLIDSSAVPVVVVCHSNYCQYCTKLLNELKSGMRSWYFDRVRWGAFCVDEQFSSNRQLISQWITLDDGVPQTLFFRGGDHNPADKFLGYLAGETKRRIDALFFS